MNKFELLKSISFGARVAEDEINELGKYFVETDQWSRMVKGDIDVVRGAKGAGKSAIYSLLITRANESFNRKILFSTRREAPWNAGVQRHHCQSAYRGG
jgi:hypothetical protein